MSSRKNFFIITLLSLFTALPVKAACLTSPVSPTSTQLITNIYGCRFHPINHKWLFHRGTDFRALNAAPLVAAREGDIQTTFSSAGGNEIRIVGGEKPVLRYLHLSRRIVEPGTHVIEGQEIARSGSSGKVTAEHLHFEITKKEHNKTSSINVDPELMLCKKIEHKPGAETSGEKPIYSPTNGVCDGNLNSQRSTFASIFSSRFFSFFTSTLTKLTTSEPASSTTPIAESPAPTIERFDDLSPIEILTSEVLKRFANPTWHAEQAERTIVPLLSEYLQIQALESFLSLHKQRVRERIETLLAIRLAHQNRQSRQTLLKQQRESAAHGASS